MSAESGSKPRHRLTTSDDVGFMLDTRSLGRKPGSMRELKRTVVTDEKIGLEMVGIPAGAQVELDLTMQSVSEGVLIIGTVSAPVEGECSRCLEPFTDQVELYLTELFAYPDSNTEKTTEEDEIHRLVDDMIELRAGGHRLRRVGTVAAAGLRAGLCGIVPGMRCTDGDCGFRPWS